MKKADTGARKRFVSLKSMEHVKRTLENTVAQESLKLESGLILLAIAVSGAPFLGLLGTVWGVMSTFGHIAQEGSATLSAMAPGVAAALITTVGGLLVAIPSMFAYNWLVHNLRAATVELDNFAQELVSKMETEYLADEDTEPLAARPPEARAVRSPRREEPDEDPTPVAVGSDLPPLD